MAHHTRKPVYQAMVERLNKFPLGAPPSELLTGILRILLSPEEAEKVALLPVRSFNERKAAQAWKISTSKARKILDNLADKGLIMDVEWNGEQLFTLPPPMAGFFEFSLMRVRSDIDQKQLSELFFQYINVEDHFIRNLFEPFETQLGRVFVNETAADRQPSLEVLNFERVSQIVGEATAIAVGVCYCRHKMMHVGRACANELNNCITLNSGAQSLIKHHIAREISPDACLDLFRQGRDAGLVQFGENVREGVNFVCNCCKCCCEGMIAARKFGWLHPVHTTAFLPEEKDGKCRKCGLCARLCPVDAITVSADSPPETGKPLQFDLDACLGCGVCVAKCPSLALRLRKREKRALTPVNSSHRVVLQAIETGTLQNLIFDNQAMESHRAMAAILGVILKLPPVKQILASRQMKSKFLDWFLSKHPFYAKNLTGGVPQNPPSMDP